MKEGEPIGPACVLIFDDEVATTALGIACRQVGLTAITAATAVEAYAVLTRLTTCRQEDVARHIVIVGKWIPEAPDQWVSNARSTQHILERLQDGVLSKLISATVLYSNDPIPDHWHHLVTNRVPRTSHGPLPGGPKAMLAAIERLRR